MGKKEFETECKKNGHQPKIVYFHKGIPIDTENAHVILECCSCGAVSTVKGKWDNPEK
jgi:hypothetical protein